MSWVGEGGGDVGALTGRDLAPLLQARQSDGRTGAPTPSLETGRNICNQLLPRVLHPGSTNPH